MRYLAIDYGNKRTGLAICDQNETVASPLTVISGHSKLVEKIAEVIRAENVGAIVVGLPLNMDNSQGSQAKLVLDFGQKLKAGLNVPVHFQDERLSSFAADEKLTAAQLPFSKKKKLRDAIAAAEILNAFLEAKHSEN